MSYAEPVAHAHKTLITLNERETVTILPMLKKLNSSLSQRFCSATFSEDSGKLYLSYTSDQEYKFAIDAIKTSLLIIFEEPPIEPGQELSEEPALKIAEIELDRQNLEFVINNIEKINNALAKRFCRYTCVSHSTRGNPQLQATDSETLKSAFEFIRSGLMNVHNSSSSLSKIKPELESIVKKFQSLTPQTAPPSYQSSDTKLDSPSRTSGHFCYQDGTNDPPHTVSTGIGVSQSTMASIGTIGGDDFLIHVKRVRSEIQDKFLKAHKVLQDREADLLDKLRELEEEFIGDMITQVIKRLSTTKDGLITSLKRNKNKDLLEMSTAPINASIVELKRKLQNAKDTYKSVTLEWDVELEDKLSLTGDILLNCVTQEQVRDYKKIEMPVARFGNLEKNRAKAKKQAAPDTINKEGKSAD